MHIGKFLSRFSGFGPPQQTVEGKELPPDFIALKKAGDEHGGAVLFGSRVVELLDQSNSFEKHKVVLDIDIPAALYESSNGNHHLFIDKTLTREQYKKVVDVLTEVGILNKFHKDHFDEKKGTYVFAPWVDKKSYKCESVEPEDTEQEII